MMPVDPSLWSEDGTLLSPASTGLGLYGSIPTEILDYTQDLCDLNPPLQVQSVRWRVAELKSEVPSWPEARELLVRELRLRWPTLHEPEAAVAEELRHALDWLRNEGDRKVLEAGGTTGAGVLARAVLRASSENWADFEHRRILSYLWRLDPRTSARTAAALPGCSEVGLRFDKRGQPTASIALDPETFRLIYREFHDGELTHVSAVVPTEFVVERFRAENDDDWFRWTQVDGKRFQSKREELIEQVRGSFRPSASMVRGLAAWLEALPRGATISTRLELKGPKNDAGNFVGWWVPPVFSRQSEGRTDAAGILWQWYRPRSREESERRLAGLLRFLTTDKLRAILCYAVGAPVASKLWPSHPVPYLELVGESNAGKTQTARAAVAVAWGLGDGFREYVGGDVTKSGFRRVDFFSATDLPILVDESSLSRTDREHMRAAANGATTSRGGTDLLHKTYRPTASPIFTCNASPDDSDSSSAEQHGDERRRIRLFFDDSDRAAIEGQRDEFERWLRTLTEGEVLEAGGDDEGGGGGAALWRLNALYDLPDAFERLKDVLYGASSGQQAVLDLGATILGIPRVRFDLERSDHAGEAFMEWLRVEIARYWEASRQAASERLPRADPVLHRFRMETRDGSEAIVDYATHAVYVTSSALDEYRAYRRRLGSSSPYHRLEDLATLAPITGQEVSDMVGIKEKGRSTARGRNVRINGAQVRAVKLLLPEAGSSEGAPKNTLPEEAPQIPPA